MKLLLTLLLSTYIVWTLAAAIEHRSESKSESKFETTTTQFRKSVQRLDAPPSFNNPSQTIPKENECKSDCVEERLADCQRCFQGHPGSVETCSKYINLVAQGEEGIASPHWTETRKTLRGDALLSMSATCVGFIAYVTKAPYSLELPNDDYLFVFASGLILENELNEEPDQNVNVVDEDVEEQIVGRAGTDSPAVRVPYRVRITIRSKQEIRQEVIRKAMAKLPTKFQYSTDTFSNITVIVKKDNVYVVIFDFKDRFLENF